jgi:tripartite-type tricarboxylate transporter receptor subunit TctC
LFGAAGMVIVFLAHAQISEKPTASSTREAYPSKPIRVVVPIAPGGGVDAMARGIGPLLSSRMGQPVVIDNRPGGGGSIGAEITSQAIPDGHTVMLASSSFVLHTLLYPARYDPVREFSAVTQVVQHPYVLLVGSSVPAANARDFVSWAKNMKGVNYASSGNGSLIHLSGELFNSMTGTRMVHVPYKGLAQAYPDIFSGQIHATFGSILSSLPHISSGRLKALAVTSLKRTPKLPDTPTLDESSVRGFDVTQWYGFFAPAKTPSARVSRLQQEIAWVLTQPDTASRIAAEGSYPVGNTAAEFTRVIAAETAKWRSLIHKAGIRAE